MRVGIIAPVPLLGLYEGDYHLVLSHLIEESPEYRKFSQSRSAVGDFIILDNSAHEFGAGESVNQLVAQAEMLHPSEVVLPDRLFSSRDTVQWAIRDYPILRERLDTDVKIVGVPQGETLESWDWCADQLLQLGVDTIGISKDYEVWAGGLPGRVRSIRNLAGWRDGVIPIHMLGWGRDLGTVHALHSMEVHPQCPIRGIDSAKPWVYALSGIQLPPSLAISPQYPGRNRRFFLSPEVNRGTRSLALRNALTFARAAGDEVLTSRLLSIYDSMEDTVDGDV